MSTNSLAIAQSYFAAIERGVTGDALASFFTSDVVQEEFPNRLTPNGIRRDRAAILEGAARGQSVLRSQRFEILGSVGAGDHIALEVQWTGVLAIPVANPSARMRCCAETALALPS